MKKKLVLGFNKTTLPLLIVVSLSACANGYQNLQNLNQSLGTVQRNVDYANSVKKTVPTIDKKQALKNAGDAMIQQSPELQQANETVKAAKALANSVKALNQ